MKTRKRKPKESEDELAKEAADLCMAHRIQNVSAEERQQIHDELLLYPKRVDALIHTLMVLSFFEFKASVNGNPLAIFEALQKTDTWREVCLSIACHHVAHKDKWKEKRK